MSRLNIKSLAVKLAEKHDFLTIEDGERLVKIVLQQIANGIEQGERTEIRGFGVFEPRVYKPGTRRNPKTGERVAVGYRGKAHFKPGKQLRDGVKALTV